MLLEMESSTIPKRFAVEAVFAERRWRISDEVNGRDPHTGALKMEIAEAERRSGRLAQIGSPVGCGRDTRRRRGTRSSNFLGRAVRFFARTLPGSMATAWPRAER